MDLFLKQRYFQKPLKNLSIEVSSNGFRDLEILKLNSEQLVNLVPFDTINYG